MSSQQTFRDLLLSSASGSPTPTPTCLRAAVAQFSSQPFNQGPFKMAPAGDLV